MRIGRWFSTDPFTQSWQSPYTSMDNKPSKFNDPKGDKIIGMSKKSAQRAEKIMKEDVFKNESFAAFRNLIKLGSDKMTFEEIKQSDYDETTKDLSEDQKL